jgi:hypothetical protein
MTTIVWDGKTLAADRQCTWDDLKSVVNKLDEIQGFLFGCAGKYAYAQNMIEWYRAGANPDDFPETNKGEDGVDMLVITPDREIFVYGESPYPMVFTQSEKIAIGTGKGIAYGAMAMGATAVQAVRIASKYDVNTGMGIDTLTLPMKKARKRAPSKFR